MYLPELLEREEIQKRLEFLFPKGTTYRGYLVREIAASTIYVMLYVGAIEGNKKYIGPKHVYRMSSDQAELRSAAERIEYGDSVIASGYIPIGQTWYADNTREPIRDETIRQGLSKVGAIVELNVPTTSPKPRYALTREFANIFDPNLTAEDLEETIDKWRKDHMNATALARIALIKAGASRDPTNFLVTFPNGETQSLSPGDSSIITKYVIEKFATRFLKEPHVVWISESGNKVVMRHELHMRKLGLKLDTEKLLPDIILIDIQSMTIVFVEVVATSGAITRDRRQALMKVVKEAGLATDNVAFVTAFLDRGPALKRVLGQLAWNTFVWVASEPNCLITLESEDGPESLWLHDRLRSRNRGD